MTRIATAALAFSLFAAPAFAGPMKAHKNLEAAHSDIRSAMEKVTKAQEANEFDMEGHAQKAKDLLAQAEHEIAQAAEAANEHKR